MRNLENEVRPPRGVQTAPSGAEVLRLEVTEIEQVANILLVSLPHLDCTVIIILKELMSLVEIMVDPEIESVP